MRCKNFRALWYKYGICRVFVDSRSQPKRLRMPLCIYYSCLIRSTSLFSCSSQALHVTLFSSSGDTHAGWRCVSVSSAPLHWVVTRFGHPRPAPLPATECLTWWAQLSTMLLLAFPYKSWVTRVRCALILLYRNRGVSELSWLFLQLQSVVW